MERGTKQIPWWASEKTGPDELCGCSEKTGGPAASYEAAGATPDRERYPELVYRQSRGAWSIRNRVLGMTSEKTGSDELCKRESVALLLAYEAAGATPYREKYPELVYRQTIRRLKTMSCRTSSCTLVGRVCRTKFFEWLGSGMSKRVQKLSHRPSLPVVVHSSFQRTIFQVVVRQKQVCSQLYGQLYVMRDEDHNLSGNGFFGPKRPLTRGTSVTDLCRPLPTERKTLKEAPNRNYDNEEWRDEIGICDINIAGLVGFSPRSSLRTDRRDEYRLPIGSLRPPY